MSFGLPSFFKTSRNKQFEYRPLFFDERKERRAELERAALEESQGCIDDDRRAERLRSKLNHRWERNSRTDRKQVMAQQRLRFMAILAFLGALVWYFFNWA